MNKSLLLTVLSCLLTQISLAADIKIQNNKSNMIGRVNVLTGVISGGVNAICLDQDVLFCGNDHRVYSLDASEPMSPKNLSYIELSGYVRQMVKQGDYLYVACRETGVWIINVADPKNMQLVSRYDPVELATGIDVAGDVMFLAMRQNGVEIVDVTDKANPTHIRLEKTNESQSVFYYDGFLYSGEWRGHHVTTISVEDISDVKTCCTSDLNGYGDGVWAHGKYLYATTGLHATGNHEAKKGDGHGLEIFRISDKSKPEFVSRLDFAVTPKTYPDYWTPRPCNNGDYVVCADTHNGIYIVDTRKKSSPKVASQLSVIKEDGSTISVTTAAVGNGVIYVGMHSELGVLAVECPAIKPVVRNIGRLPKNASYRYPYETSAGSHFTSWKPMAGAPVRGVAATDSVLYVASAHGGLAMLSMDRDGNVIQVGKGPMKYAGDVKVLGDKLIVAEGYEGFAVYRIGKELKELGRYNLFEREGEKSLCLWVFAPSENCVVASTRLHGYYYFDISNLPEINSLGRLGRGPGWDKYVADRADSKGWYPRLWHNSGPFWANLNDISKGETKDNGFRTTLFDGVCLYKNDQFITCSCGKMYVYSAQDMGKTRTGTGEGLYGAPAWDGAALVGLTARIDRQISLVQMSERNVPILLWTEKCDGFPEIGTFWNGRFVVPCGHQGLLIEKK